MFNDFHHNKRHDDRADVRNGLGEDQTVQTDQSVGDEQYRQENESLAADGQDQRCQTVSHALESVVVHEDNAQERSGDHQRPEHLHGVVLLGDNICRRAGRAGGHKDADDRLSEQEVQRRQNQPQHQGADHAEPYHFCHLGEVPCAVVESHQRLDADTDAQLDEHYQHICFHGDAHAAGGENVDVIQQPVQHQVGQAHQHISEKHGDADGEHAAENAAFHGEVLRIRGEHGAADFQIDEVEQRCHRVADAGGDGCTLDAHAHGKDHDGVQDDVGHSADHHAEHGDFRRTLALDQVAHGAAQHRGDCTHADVEQIVPGVLFQILIVLHQLVIGVAGNILGNIGDVGGRICTHQRQDPAHAQGQRQGGEQSHKDSAPETEAADFFHPFIFPCAQRTGDKGAAADAEQVAECHEDHKHRGRHGNGIHLIGVVGLSYKDCVHHVVQHGDQHTQHRRDRQYCHSLGDRLDLKNGGFLFFHLHIGITSFLLRRKTRQKCGDILPRLHLFG